MFKLFNRKPKINPKKEQQIETVNDLLAKDDIHSVIEDAIEHKKNMKCLVMVWLDNDDGLHYYTSTTNSKDTIYMLDECKFQFRTSGNDDE